MHPDQTAPIGCRSTKPDEEQTTIVVNGRKRVNISFKNISFISQQSDVLMDESFQDFFYTEFKILRLTFHRESASKC